MDLKKRNMNLILATLFLLWGFRMYFILNTITDTIICLTLSIIMYNANTNRSVR